MKLYIFILILYSSVNFSQNYWEPKGLNEKSIGFISGDSSGKLFASQKYGDSIFISTDNGKFWQFLSEIENNNTLVSISSILIVDTNNFIASTYIDGNGIYKSTDQGNSWTPKNNNLDTYNFTKVVNHNDTLYASSDIGLFRSLDNGENWLKLNQDSIIIDDFVIMPNSIIVSVEWNDAYKSIDNGVNWSKLNIVNSHPYYKNVCYSKNGILYIGTNGQGVFKSTDYGESWVLNIPVNYLAVDVIAFNSSDYLLVGGEISGCYFTLDGGSTWMETNLGLPNTFINTIYFDENDFAYIGLSNNGIYKSVIPITSIEEDLYQFPTSYYLFQNHPNPFNPSTVIKCVLKDAGLVKLKVYDILGSEVATLVNETKEAGNFAVEFNSTNLPSGVYIYTLQVNNFTSSKKMVLMK